MKEVKISDSSSPVNKKNQNLSLLGKHGVSDFRRSNKELTSEKRIHLMEQIDEEDP